MELGVQLEISWKHRISVMHGQQMPCPVEPWKHLCKRQSWRNVWVSFPWKEPSLASDSVGFLMLAVCTSLANWQRDIRLNLGLSLLLCRRVYPSCVVSVCKFTSLLKRILELFASLLWIAKYFWKRVLSEHSFYIYSLIFSVCFTRVCCSVIVFN